MKNAYHNHFFLRFVYPVNNEIRKHRHHCLMVLPCSFRITPGCLFYLRKLLQHNFYKPISQPGLACFIQALLFNNSLRAFESNSTVYFIS